MKKNLRPMANTQLVAAVKLDQYNSMTFYLLAENLFYLPGQCKKAKSCAERSLLLNPNSEKCTKLLDDINLKLGESISNS